MIDDDGYRLNVGMIIVNADHHLFLAKRLGQDAWQFPQGGMQENEQPVDTLHRELTEEVGLIPADVEVIAETQAWLSYRLPKHLIRQNPKQRCIGQKQKWFALRLVVPESKIQLNLSQTPEFDSWRWVDYWYPLKAVINFKKHVYKQALHEFHDVIHNRAQTGTK